MAIVPRPRGGDWLADEIARMREAGLDIIVSLLEPAESLELLLEEQQAACAAANLTFLPFPIPDRNIPSSTEEATSFLAILIRHLDDGQNIGIHCRQSVGRSGLIAAALLVIAGQSPQAAIDVVSAARGQITPETHAQTEWIKQLALSRAC